MKGKKIVPGFVAGSLMVVVSWGLTQFAKVPLPGEVVAALTGLLSIGISVITPDNLEADE